MDKDENIPDNKSLVNEICYDIFSPDREENIVEKLASESYLVVMCISTFYCATTEFLTTLKNKTFENKSFENTMEKGEMACNKPFLLFHSVSISFGHFH